MNVRTLCLAILHDGETTGYDIRKYSTEGDCSYFVEASYGSIYPALAKMEAEGLVTSRVEAQDGKPSKKVYAITSKGRSTFIDSLFEDLSDDVIRSEFLLFARFASELPAGLVRQRLNERIEKLDGEISQFEQMLEEREHKGDLWILNYGLNCLRVARDHLSTHMGELIDMAQPDDGATKAAE